MGTGTAKRFKFAMVVNAMLLAVLITSVGEYVLRGKPYSATTFDSVGSNVKAPEPAPEGPVPDGSQPSVVYVGNRITPPAAPDPVESKDPPAATSGPVARPGTNPARRGD